MASIFFAVMLSVIASSLKQGVFDNLVKMLLVFILVIYKFINRVIGMNRYWITALHFPERMNKR